MKGLMFGPPGAGKGTQGALLQKKLHIPVISTGQIFRDAISNGSSDALKLKEIIASGQLVSDEIVIDIAIDRISMEDCDKGFILDGFPRTIHQAQVAHKLGVRFDFILELVLDPDEIVRRISGRRFHPESGRTYHITDNPPKNPGFDDLTGEPLICRDDDTMESILERIKIYEDKTKPILDYFTSEKNDFRLEHIQVDGDTDINTVHSTILEKMRKCQIIS